MSFDHGLFLGGRAFLVGDLFLPRKKKEKLSVRMEQQDKCRSLAHTKKQEICMQISPANIW
ncbi:hypothetical protein IGI04_030905 [Brassica rapa subsp. trilocularis]|uniref:Uncharacterized protein n=1 Tax=Brassica rapa subsp. trilocularis TaxID=1813537 RepID=A0ABQ7LS47_BRACM|nr:hypothetical protein IGI04_030905 [Brassica rapa subsp. trilocularis]